MRKLLILDGNSVLHRAYYALPDWRNRSGEATAGVYGFLSMMLKAIDELKPTHLIVVFDHPTPTFRHTMYVGYQTNREKDRQISEDIWGQVEKLKQVCQLLNLPVFQLGGFEADDLIGTLAKKAKKFDQVVIVTGDRDIMQLVNDRISLYMPIRGVTDAILVGPDQVVERMGVRPDQIIDYKALVGDSSDNYPGVAGIGPKTAVQLLERFGSFEEIVKKSGNSKVIAGYGGGELSQRLARIKTDVPISIDWEKAIVPSQEKTLEVLRELGYKSLVRRAGGEMEKSQPGLFD